MGISGISGGGAGPSAAQSSAMRQKMVARMQKDMDVDGDGAISKDEFEQATERMRSHAPKGASANAPSADELFTRADTDGNGSLSTEELTQLAESMKPPHGGPPGRCAPAGGAGGSDGAAGASASAKSNDPADADHDGQVTSAERQAYDLKKLTAAWRTANAESSTGDDLSAA